MKRFPFTLGEGTTHFVSRLSTRQPLCFGPSLALNPRNSVLLTSHCTRWRTSRGEDGQREFLYLNLKKGNSTGHKTIPDLDHTCQDSTKCWSQYAACHQLEGEI